MPATVQYFQKFYRTLVHLTYKSLFVFVFKLIRKGGRGRSFRVVYVTVKMVRKFIFLNLGHLAVILRKFNRNM
jgi:hypothetical protein